MAKAKTRTTARKILRQNRKNALALKKRCDGIRDQIRLTLLRMPTTATGIRKKNERVAVLTSRLAENVATQEAVKRHRTLSRAALSDLSKLKCAVAAPIVTTLRRAARIGRPRTVRVSVDAAGVPVPTTPSASKLLPPAKKRRSKKRAAVHADTIAKGRPKKKRAKKAASKTSNSKTKSAKPRKKRAKKA